MWEELIKISIGAGIVIAVSLVAYWAAKKWKSKYRDELRAWLYNHPNDKFKKIGLKLVLAVDTAEVLGERIIVDIFGKSEDGRIKTITTKTLTHKEAEGLGLIQKNAVQNEEVDLYNESEILAIMNG